MAARWYFRLRLSFAPHPASDSVNPFAMKRICRPIMSVRIGGSGRSGIPLPQLPPARQRRRAGELMRRMLLDRLVATRPRRTLFGAFLDARATFGHRYRLAEDVRLKERDPPEQLGKYPLLGVIGEGSMGVIYRSIDPHIKRPVALKTMRRELLEDPSMDFPARFRNEAQAAGGLAHPGIVAVYEYGEDGSYAYIAMEYVEGRNLRECFKERIPFSVAQVVSIMAQLLAALQYAHERGVWHRDINPANILLMRDGRIKVTDFGIARIGTSLLTQVGAIMGTPGFIAPEVYLGDKFDARVDLFAAGAVLYQLLAGTPPFTGTAEKIMFKVCYETPLPASVAGRVPALEAFDAVVMRALARRPEDRFASATEFLAALFGAQGSVGGQGVADATIIQTPPY